MAYLSCEVRFKHLQMLAATNPKALMEMTKRLHGMETSLGFHAAVLSLLGMQPTEYLMGLPDAELAKLIYRDDITIKHASRQRLADELQDKADGSAKNPEKMAVCDTNEKTQGAGALSKALVQYLLKVSRVKPDAIFAWDARSMEGVGLTTVDAARITTGPAAITRPPVLEGDSWIVSLQGSTGSTRSCMSLSQLSSLVLLKNNGVPMDKSSLPDDSLSHMFFGKPVEGNLAHHTVMGQQLQKFDFLVQPFALVEAEWDDETHTWTSITLIQHGAPMTCRLGHIPFDTLSKNLNVWTSPETGYRVFLKMPSISSELLLSMAVAGAFWRHGNAFFVRPEDEGLDFLLEQKLVGKKDSSDLDMFNITIHGAKVLNVSQTFSTCTLLAGFNLDTVSTSELDFKTMTEFEHVLQLTSLGWQYECKSLTKKIHPYTETSEKTWFYQNEARVNKNYLEVLIKSQALFQKGLKEIHHFQKKRYYVALLQVPDKELNQLLPWQPESYYKVFMNKLKNPKTTSASKSSGLETDDHRIVAQAEPRANPVQSGKGRGRGRGHGVSRQKESSSGSTDSSGTSSSSSSQTSDDEMNNSTHVDEKLEVDDRLQNLHDYHVGPVSEKVPADVEILVEDSDSEKDSALQPQAPAPSVDADASVQEPLPFPAETPAPRKGAAVARKRKASAQDPPGRLAPTVPRVLRGGPPSSMFNLSSVWVQNVAFVQRTDQGKPSYYVRCPLHGTKLRSCTKTKTVGDDTEHGRDLVIRQLMDWLLRGFEMETANQTPEEIRSQHVRLALRPLEQLPLRGSLEEALTTKLNAMP